MKYILAIDQGTTSSRAIVFTQDGKPVGQAQVEFEQFFPQSGWVEHDAEEIWQTVINCCQQAVASAQLSMSDILAIGITNQRETTVVWDRATGQPIYHAIVWQDRRTANVCQQLEQAGHETLVQAKTGLLLDPYFSATKLAWLLDHVPNARVRAEKGELAFGTIDSYLLYRLTGGQQHATDITNASRTLLFNIHTQTWDKELLSLFDIPEQMLPKVLDNNDDFGVTESDILGAQLPIAAMAGDQHAALVGQACFQPGMIKSTYGTGCFMMLNTGERAVTSQHRLLTTVAYRINGQIRYALEGSIFAAGSTIKWLRDQLGIIKNSNETEALARQIEDTGGVYFVPAFTGLGAPHWNPDARAAIHGLTRATDRASLVRAGLESVAYQSRDLLAAMQADGVSVIKELRVDGGMVANDWLLQFLADMLHLPVDRPQVIETTALGVAYLAGLQMGLYDSLDEIAKHWQSEQRFTPSMDEPQRQRLYRGWQGALQRVLN